MRYAVRGGHRGPTVYRFEDRMVDEQDAIRPHIKIFVNRVQADGLGRALGPADEVLVVAALSGG